MYDDALFLYLTVALPLGVMVLIACVLEGPSVKRKVYGRYLGSCPKLKGGRS